MGDVVETSERTGEPAEAKERVVLVGGSAEPPLGESAGDLWWHVEEETGEAECTPEVDEEARDEVDEDESEFEELSSSLFGADNWRAAGLEPPDTLELDDDLDPVSKSWQMSGPKRASAFSIKKVTSMGTYLAVSC